VPRAARIEASASRTLVSWTSAFWSASSRVMGVPSIFWIAMASVLSGFCSRKTSAAPADEEMRARRRNAKTKISFDTA